MTVIYVVFLLCCSNSSALSQHDAQLLASGHHAELFRLAVDQRYAHEYGDSCVTDDPASSTAAVNNQCDISEASPSQRISPEKQPQHTAGSQPSHCDLQTHDLQTEKEPVETLNPKMYGSHAQHLFIYILMFTAFTL